MSFWPHSKELSDVVQIVRPLGASVLILRKGALITTPALFSRKKIQI